MYCELTPNHHLQGCRYLSASMRDAKGKSLYESNKTRGSGYKPKTTKIVDDDSKSSEMLGAV